VKVSRDGEWELNYILRSLGKNLALHPCEALGKKKHVHNFTRTLIGFAAWEAPSQRGVDVVILNPVS